MLELPSPRVLRKRRVPTAGELGDQFGEAKADPFAITVNEDMIGVVSVDLERGAPGGQTEAHP